MKYNKEKNTVKSNLRIEIFIDILLKNYKLRITLSRGRERERKITIILTKNNNQLVGINFDQVFKYFIKFTELTITL